MKISIIVPVYNVERYLKDCLDSLVKQTWKDIEIIIINDGSTDGSAAICESYLSDSRVVYRYQENAGVSAARNLGLSLATGDYIGFVDSDDWLELDAMERLQGETADIVLFNYFRGDRKHIEPLTDGVYSREALFPKMIGYIDENGEISYISHAVYMRLFKKKLIEENYIRFNPQYQNGEDLLFAYEATMKAEMISVRCSDYLYHYRPVQNSLSTSYINNYWANRKNIIKEIYNMIESDILLDQMPLRIFLWTVVGIEQELKISKERLEKIKEIVSDPICGQFIGKLDINVLKKKNQCYYIKISNGDYKGIVRDYKKEQRVWKLKRFLGKIKRAVYRIFSKK